MRKKQFTILAIVTAICCAGYYFGDYLVKKYQIVTRRKFLYNYRWLNDYEG